ncbi:T9SS type A sorting domain-containing protein [Polaribacter porphyrae]|uniref:Fibronectin type-III domain-containing protein n=1 Tax=Polaribacter porphyrae TaxID=1137780 RepID=A0A2S7WML3_9FLAO|nr:T9SS type A sorting domain-containing protein [Polaribacter porphyrae]PQJ78819.1 hypothetical protein BTO18_06300 [Polaribacter porphyrae]
MKNNLLLLAIALFVNTIYSQTITFDDQSHTAGQILANPYLITNNGETFRFTISGGAATNHIYRTAEPSCGTNGMSHIYAGNTSSTTWTIETVNGNKFNLGTIRFDNVFSCFAFSYSLTIEGFKNNMSTGTQSHTVSGTNSIFTSNSNFNEVDKIVISASDLGNLGIDNINWVTVVSTVVPTVTSSNAINISASAATFGGNVTADGGATVSNRGVVYAVSSTNSNPEIGGTGVQQEQNGTGTGVFSENITGLAPSTTYAYKAYATNSVGTSYGATLSFTTSNVPPTVVTTAASSISGTSVTLAGNVTVDGGSSVTERGIVYSISSTNSNPLINGTGVTKDINGTGTGVFSKSINNFLLSTNYSFKAYAINAEGTSYGAVQTFSTLAGNTNSFLPSSGNWSDTGNWSLAALPISTDNVVIETGKTVFYNIINTTVASLNINVGGTINILSGNGLTINGDITQNGTFNILSDANSNGSLIVNGSYSGSQNVNYLRYLTTNWHLITSPVNGLNINALSGNVATNGNNYAIAPYVNTVVSASRWNYYTTASGGNSITSAGNFQDAKGYSIKKSIAAGTVNFSGSLNTTDKNIPITDGGDDPAGNRWNLVGNPYTATLYGNNLANATHNFLKTNIDAGNLDPVRAGLYFWNGTPPYEVKSIDDAAFYIAPGQAFFVHAPDNGGTFVNFTENMQTHQTGNTFLKNNTTFPEIILKVKENKNTSSTKIRYIANKTIGLDIGSDVGTFSGINPEFEIFTNLVSNDTATKFAIQALPKDNLEQIIIPIGVTSGANKEIEFTVEANNFPTNLNIYLEDRLLNIFTKFENENSNYKITSSTNLKDVGRFYLHISSKKLSVKDNLLTNISMYMIKNNTIRIEGLQYAKAEFTMYNLIGKKIVKASFSNNDAKDVSLPKLSTGVYLITLVTEKGNLHKKIILE